MTDEPLRPDPDVLLAQADNDGRGKLKIYFVSARGVGKTWAILQEARRPRARGESLAYPGRGIAVHRRQHR